MNILIVEDDQGISELIAERISESGYQCIKSFNAADTVRKISSEIIDFMILDYKLPDMDAAELLDKLEEKKLKVPAFICSTGQGDEMVAVDMMKRGARDYIIKDAKFLEILPQVIKREIKNLKNEIELEKTKEQKEQMIKKLIQTKEEAIKANKIKSEFLANMSHELRTPLNGIMGFAQILKRTTLSREQLEFVDTILLSGNNLLQLINMILDFSKIEAAKLILEPTDTNIREIFNNSISMIIPIIEKKNIKFTTTIDERIPHFLKIDALRLTQILMNLFSNSVKFTDEGHIDFIVNMLNKTNTFTELELKVIDTGIGIPPDKYQKILQAFTQVDASTTRKYGGTGLGLTITNSLLKLMGSQLIIESELNKGSCFSFIVRFENCSEQCSTGEKKSTISNHYSIKKILLVEDNIINLAVIKHIIQNILTDSEILTAKNGCEAIDKHREFHPDFIFMDLQMPHLSGYEATRRIRKTEGSTDRIPIIALTADARKEVVEKCQKYGLDDLLVKPVEVDQIYKMIKKYSKIL